MTEEITFEERRQMKEAGICYGCRGQGWVTVVDPVGPSYTTLGAGDNQSTAMPQRLPVSGIARAVLCPVCQGTGMRS
jgi:hypothetical protein